MIEFIAQSASVTLVDNLVTVPLGTQVRSREMLVRPNGTTGLFAGDLAGAMVSIWHTTAEGIIAHGSGFMVELGVAITARHVIDEIMEKEASNPTISVCGMVGGELRYWDVRAATLMNGSDIAVLSLCPRFELGSDVLVDHFVISARAPGQGEMLMGLGLKATESAFVADGDEKAIVELLPICSSGNVTQLHISRGFLSRGPSLETNMLMLGGMSGGPVFDAEGYVIGLNSTSMDHGDGEFTSYVALLFPALNEVFNPAWPAGLLPANCRLLDLRVKHRNLVHFDPNGVVRFGMQR